MTYAIGTPVIDHYGTRGFIGAALEPESKIFIIGAGMSEVRTEYEVYFDNGRVSRLSDGIVAPFVAHATHLPKVENIEERKMEIRAIERAAKDEQRRAADEATTRREAFKAEAREKTPAWAKAVIVAELQADRSDSMTDYFHSQTMRTVVLGFSRHTRDLFPEMRKFAATFEETAHLADAPESAEHREKWSMGAGYYLKAGYRHDDGWQVRKLRLYNGAESMPDHAEWHISTPSENVAPATESANVEGMRLEEHKHTTKGFQMFIAIMPGRVERDEFNRLLDAAKLLGGWYSRPWNGTPGGFAFKDRAKAETFVTGQPAAESSETVSPRAAPGMGDKLRELADRLQSDIDHKFASRRTNTPKRRREVDAARLEGNRLERTQQALRALAAHHDAGTVPAILRKVTSKAKAFELMASVIDRSNAGYYDAGVDTGKPAMTTPGSLALWAMIEGQSEEKKQAEELRRKEDSLQFANIPGYFPTPAAIVADIIEAAGIPDSEPVDVLEPEGGSGAILDEVKKACPLARLTTYERHESLREVLRLKGYSLAGSDFLEAEAVRTFDRVLMNPPFENGQDITHVRHAFDFLKPGGRLVAIMSPGPFFRKDRKAQEFRDWFENLGGYKTDIPAGAFKESGTGIATVMIVLEA